MRARGTAIAVAHAVIIAAHVTFGSELAHSATNRSNRLIRIARHETGNTITAAEVELRIAVAAFGCLVLIAIRRKLSIAVMIGIVAES